ncbi:MAG: hypothetical protein ACI3U8_00845 [Candidatus Onthomonas sp.]
MKIISVVNRELTDREITSMQRFRSYTDGVSFACLQERVMVILYDEPSKEVEKLKAKALEHMETALSEHPDMSTWEMNDDCQMVGLPSGIFAISSGPAEGNFRTHLSLRNECLEACENGEVVAVAYEEE